MALVSQSSRPPSTTMWQSSRALEKRAEENTWVSTWTGKQLIENKGSREATPESLGVPWGERLMECHDDRKRRT